MIIKVLFKIDFKQYLFYLWGIFLYFVIKKRPINLFNQSFIERRLPDLNW